MPKTQKKQDDAQDRLDFTLEAAGHLARSYEVAKQMFGVEATAEVALAVFDRIIDDDGENPDALEDLKKAQKLTQELFGIGTAPQVTLDVYDRAFSGHRGGRVRSGRALLRRRAA